MLLLAALSGGLTWSYFPGDLAGAPWGTLAGIGIGVCLTLLFLGLMAFWIYLLLGAMGLRGVEGRIEVQEKSLAWRLEFDTDAAIGDVQAGFKVIREVWRCRLVRREVLKRRPGHAGHKEYAMAPDWTSQGEEVLLERRLCTGALPASKVLSGSVDIVKPLPHPRTTTAWADSARGASLAEAAAAIPAADPVGRSLLEAAACNLDSSRNDTVAVRLDIRWRIDLFAERPGWPDAAIELLLGDHPV